MIRVVATPPVRGRGSPLQGAQTQLLVLDPGRPHRYVNGKISSR
jgi:hypothetical protein